MNGGAIIARGEKTLPLSLRVLVSLAHHLTDAHIFHAPTTQKKSKHKGWSREALLSKLCLLCPRKFVGIVSISTSYMADILTF